MQRNEIYFKGSDCYWRSHKLGTILQSESIFRSVKRTRKNIFRLFGDGLGINEELLVLLKNLGIKYIVVPFCDELLKTTVDKFLRLGIRSPFCNERVDRQLILNINRINMDEDLVPRRKIGNGQQLLLQLEEVMR